MMLLVLPALLLSLAVDASPDDRFFISAPNVFHIGVKEKVFVQMGKNHLNKIINIYLELENSNIVLSDRVSVNCTKEEKGKEVELMINQNVLSTLRERPRYMKLVAEGFSIDREMTRVLLSQHRGYIFIQTDQPLYKPTDTVQYRIFTLDHTFRPSNEIFHLAVYNAVGNRAMKTIYTSKGGILERNFVIPDVAKAGIWRIVAHYEGDAAHAISKEFKVQKFVMPSFEVNIQMENKYILVNTNEEINFKISARYTHANTVNGSYHCQFGVIKKGPNAKPTFIKGMEQAGSVLDGTASVSVNIIKLNQCVQNQMNLHLSDLEDRGELLYLGVLVTNIQNGEIQERQIFIPAVSHKYRIDLSRTHSYFIPGFPINVAALVYLPDGSPAEKVSVNLNLMEENKESKTNLQGAVFHTFNAKSINKVTFTVSVDDSRESKVIEAAVSPINTYLYLNVEYKEYSVGESLRVMLRTTNSPQNGFIHYLVLSRGSIVETGHVVLGEASVLNLQISEHMVPSFRLIAYFYTPNNDIISNSVWLAVKGNCEEKVKVELKGSFEPRSVSQLHIDLNGQEATVALMAVDTAFNSLNADNKLTPEQVYSSMEAYDLGCSYGGGPDPRSVLLEAGLAFFTTNKNAVWRQDLTCHSTARQKRSVDLEQEMMALKSKYEEETLQSCCARGFLLIPMQLTCEERATRVSKLQNDPNCTDAFRACCIEGQRLRDQRNKEEAKKGLGRTASLLEIEEHFMNTDNPFIRKFFHSSFAFKSFPVKGKTSYSLGLPDSITTWEIQVVTLSKASGLCVKKPSLLRAFKPAFVSLRLPTSVKKYEQMYISPVIYNYMSDNLHVAVHMAQSEGLCSPGSATSLSFVKINVSPDSSQTVTFSAVPMRSGSIPITIRLYDINMKREVDAIEKPLNVWTAGIEKTEEETTIIHLNGTNNVALKKIDGTLPDDTVPGSASNIFISIEEDGFSSSRVRNLLSPEKVAKLIHLPGGCLEQTTRTLAPTTVAVRYLDMSDQWFNMPPKARDEALDYIGKGVDRYINLLRQNKKPGAYGLWPSKTASTWLTAHVVKVLSLLGKRQLFTFGPNGRQIINSLTEELAEGVRYLGSKQETDGSFRDANPVYHRHVLVGLDTQALTAFITLALTNSLELLEEQDKSSTEAVISKATHYLRSKFDQLQHPLALAITAYALSLHKDYAEDVHRAIDWARFETTDKSAIAVEASAYALLTAVALKDVQQAHKLAHWLTMQEKYYDGFYSSQDTLVALEALSEYELMEPARPDSNVQASFTVQGKNHIETLRMESKEKVEKNLKRFVGSEITAEFKGQGKAKVKVMKVFHLMEPKDVCNKLSIKVTVKGKVKYTAAIQDNYEYYDDDNTEQSDDPRVRRSAIEWFDIRTRRRRDIDNDQADDQFVTYEICVEHSPSYNLTGMAIVDLTLLSGFVAEAEDLEALKAPPEQYISHYELSHGKVLIYLNELVEQKQCFEFDAKQLYTVGLLQPAPAVFYDYYEPSQKCTVFYSAPKRSKVISKLCSGDVCQCAERPCYKLRNTFKHAEINSPITMSDRQDFACFYPLVDYAYRVTVLEISQKNNFELYKIVVTDVLKFNGDHLVRIGSHRVFVKRWHCKGTLEVETEYLIMGKDGTTTDSHGEKQYLLDVNTWVEPKPMDCEKSAHISACNYFNTFVEEFKRNSCKQ